ncbi:NADH-quinone oxidoreductase subunit NuoN [Pontibacillus yanchengensis]|uniref:NADH-quinone oxidoreductase subunit N n=1 Tax=Pontibacillus yanchengensis Y32 TaxID=1385514 RepID=A0A0A2TCL0_9BACI|nr:NADH-quinone oxidoreductase subunit NuoN [Pontibacillus yanchengensis]KGP71796.1 NADH:ubiquinone oxidoreductase subunit N [Pontibacillus yanchengensis Y32]
MDMETLLAYDWGIMAPEFTIVIIATLLSLLDLFLPHSFHRKWLSVFAGVGILVAFVFTLSQLGQEADMILYDTYRLDLFATSFKLLLLIGAGLVLGLSASYHRKREQGEFYYLLLTALLGAMMMASSADLITLFVGLELLSISSYILAGIDKQSLKSNESAMKYVINGGMATAITLFGFSYLYGLTGSTQLTTISEILPSLIRTPAQGLLIMAFIMTFVGLAFKISTVPFHMWTPDVYEGAPIPVTAFLSVVSKAAGFIILLRVFLTLFGTLEGLRLNETFMQSMALWIGVLAALTMILGNILALRQHNMKRLFAYSSVAHAGYLLVPVVALSTLTLENIWFYLLVYMFMTVGGLAIIYVLYEKHGTLDLEMFSGLYKRSPALAILMTIFILSLAGIPGTAGFIGKLNIILGALSTDPAPIVLVSIMIAATVLSYVFYFGILVQIYFRSNPFQVTIKVPIVMKTTLWICAIAIIGLGILPNLALDFYHHYVDLINVTEMLWMRG